MVVPKFRAYNPANNKWYNSEEVFVCDGKIYLNDEDFEDLTQNNDVELMQSTGLFDVNGKEIFEGDVVESTWWKDDNDFCGYRKAGKVVNRNGYFGIEYLEDVGKGYPTTILGFAIDVEIIGNIYENPELVEVNND